ncbi:hypothetical protein [Clostridium formicaceticum]|uniref:Uncharacterized protein n=1 Tax=Clostridium formicaceticum TaxID=1497 RepID=A0AAC9WGE7_9CLOT|nr:hypothetical protein [Clostridium formicaceticum]AOY77209.1 hypothetical protein BJL90_15945 [Clostridium formicaceticum]ARE87734.1 hypothetical protein CLFO_21340 [Clostridium formicaceticum]
MNVLNTEELHEKLKNILTLLEYGQLLELMAREVNGLYENKNCSYCDSIEKATPASPRKKYLYCPMCGRDRRDKAVVESLELAQGKHLDLLAEQIYQNRHHGETSEEFRERVLKDLKKDQESEEHMDEN